MWNRVECCHEFGDDVGSHRVVLSIDRHKIKCSRRVYLNERTNAIATDQKTHKITIPVAAQMQLEAIECTFNFKIYYRSSIHTMNLTRNLNENVTILVFVISDQFEKYSNENQPSSYHNCNYYHHIYCD